LGWRAAGSSGCLPTDKVKEEKQNKNSIVYCVIFYFGNLDWISSSIFLFSLSVKAKQRIPGVLKTRREFDVERNGLFCFCECVVLVIV